MSSLKNSLCLCYSQIIKNRIRSVEVESGEGILLEGSGEMHNDQHRETENTQVLKELKRLSTLSTEVQELIN